MIKKIAIIISPNWKDYAVKYLAECIESIRKQDYKGETKVFITDNKTSEGSFQYLRKIAPEVIVHRNKTNDGFAKGNNDAMRLALKQGFEYIFLVNMDTIVAPDCLSELIKAVESDSNIGAVQARLMLHPETDKINSLGNISHFLGFGYSLGYRDKIRNWNLYIFDRDRGLEVGNLTNIHYPSGAAALFTRQALKKLVYLMKSTGCITRTRN